MKALKLKLVFDRKKRVTSPKIRGQIDIYVYDPNSKRKTYVSTGISVLQSQFQQPKGEMGEIIKHPNAVPLNAKLREIYRALEDYTLSSQCKTIQDISNWDAPEEKEEEVGVVEFIEQELGRRDPSLNVIKRHNILIKRIEQFGEIKNLSDLTYENIVGFDRFLRNGDGDEVEGINSATAQKRHTAFKSYIIEAVNLGLCDYNPYITFKPKLEKSKDPVYLTEEELTTMANFELGGNDIMDRLLRVRDLFVFQCYTGLAYIDLKSFCKDDIIEIEGYKAIKSNRHKTDVNFLTVLLPEAMGILEKYDYDLPVLSNQKYNEYLKALPIHITDKKGKPFTTKKLTSHVARHTCGTYLLNKNVPIETVARTLGHTNTDMTRHYARLLGKTVVNDIAKYVINAKE